ncbi:MAG: sulfotransferase [Geodermatophilaceae bacterium]|nr:sulfotransferase [Geodermatophilaceae bacterium]
MVTSPVFLLSSIRSGSTLLRCILNTHSRIHAPHELHLTDVRVSFDGRYANVAMGVSELSTRELEYLLWDRILHRSLVASGKAIVVDKTPSYALNWRRLVECWPQARFVFLLRDPAEALASAYEASPDRDPAHAEYIVTSLIDGVDEARGNVDGHEVRYERLTAEPERTVAGLCRFLGEDFEATMLEYTIPEVMVPGIGDFTDNVKTGRVQPPRRRAASVSAAVAERRRRWGYETST